MAEMQKTREGLDELRESEWTLEEGVLRDLLNLQNCDSDSTFEERTVVSQVLHTSHNAHNALTAHNEYNKYNEHETGNT